MKAQPSGFTFGFPRNLDFLPGIIEKCSVTAYSEVFITGGLPKHTYIDRENGGLERRLSDAIEDGHRLIVVAGPTKSGKTVLVRTLTENRDTTWIEGGSITSTRDFWEQFLQSISGHSSVQTTAESSVSEADGAWGGEASFGIAKFEKTGKSFGTERAQSVTTSIDFDPKVQVLEKLKTPKNIILVLDDFHYIPAELQAILIRALKGPIFEGLRVVALAVPHRRYDAVRVEKEMTGRIDTISIPEWTDAELQEIANKGFPLLNVDTNESVVRTLTKEAYGSPHLMQEFCKRLVRQTGIAETQDQKTQLKVPDTWPSFFQECSAQASKQSFEKLVRGPRQRSDRKKRTFQDGSQGDIYEAVLQAIAHATVGGRVKLTYEDIRNSLRNVLKDQIPQAHEVTRVLDKLTELASAEGGEIILEWDRQTQVLHLGDPFFTFYLKWNVAKNTPS